MLGTWATNKSTRVWRIGTLKTTEAVKPRRDLQEGRLPAKTAKQFGQQTSMGRSKQVCAHPALR